MGRLPICSHSLAAGRLNEVKKIHNHTVGRLNDLPLFKENNLMHQYVKHGSLVDARHVFENMQMRDVVSWNIMILGYAKQEEGALALDLYAQMQQEGVQPSARTFVGVLKACSSLVGLAVEGDFVKNGCLEKARAIHSEVVKAGFESDVFVGTTLVDMNAKCGSMQDARFVFDELPHRNVVSWNAMILGYGKKQEGALAWELYVQMQEEGFRPDHRTFVGALKACSSLAALEDVKQVDGKLAELINMTRGRAIHFQVVKCGFESDVFVGTTLVDMYVKCGSMEDARCVFDKSSHHDVVSWTAMIMGYSKQEEGALALELYARMKQAGVTPDHRTFVGALKACSSLGAMDEGKQVDESFTKIGGLKKGRAIHSQVLKNGLNSIKTGFDSNVFLGNALVDMYVKCGSMEDAQCVFNRLPRHTLVSWNAMILGYSKQGEGGQALELCAWMQQEGVTPDHRTFVGILKACSSLAELEGGKQFDGKFVKTGYLDKGRAIHSKIVKIDFETDVFVGTSLVEMYAKCRSINDARCVYDMLPYRDEVTWATMILGYAEEEENEEAFIIYEEMQEQGLTPDSWAFVAMLKACSNTAVLESGKEIHSQICRVGLETVTIVASSLIDMYAKCGSMVNAQKVFEGLSTRDIVTWSSLIAGYACQGDNEVVFHLFERLSQEGILPDGVTFLSVLTACSHVGLVDKGQKYFQDMTEQYGVIPTMDHYICMVDLLGRAGQVLEAVAMVERMPFKPNLVLWLTVLAACRKWKNVEVGRHAFENVVRLDANHPAAYVLMSNIYTESS